MSTRTRIGVGALIGNACLLAGGLALGSTATIAFTTVGAITGSIWAAMTIRGYRKENPR